MLVYPTNNPNDSHFSYFFCKEDTISLYSEPEVFIYKAYNRVKLFFMPEFIDTKRIKGNTCLEVTKTA